MESRSSAAGGGGPLSRDDVLSAMVMGVPSGSAQEPVSERLLRAVSSHVAEVEESLKDYRRLAETGGDAATRLVMRMVLEDEERHHGLLERIATSLRDELGWTDSSEGLPVE